MEAVSGTFPIVAGITAFFSGVIAWLWRIKGGEISFWKDRCIEHQKENEKLQKENEKIWKYPGEAATHLIAAAEAVYSAQIEKLRAESLLLQEKLKEKEKQLAELRSSVETNMETIEFLEESKQMLERKIAVYNNFVESLASKKKIAEATLNAFRSNVFHIDDLAKNLGTELNDRFKEIDRTSFIKTAKAEGERVDKRARESAIAEHAARAEKERQEAIAKGANKKHARFEDDAKRSS